MLPIENFALESAYLEIDVLRFMNYFTGLLVMTQVTVTWDMEGSL